MSINLKLWSNPKFTNKESIPITYNLEPGIYMLIGSNGVGKSTLLKQIDSLFNEGTWKKIESNDVVRDKYGCYLYDNAYEEKFTKSTWGEEHLERIAETFSNSEGQDIWDYLFYKIGDIGRAVRIAKQKGKKGMFILFDGLDSGLSLDKIYKLKSNLLDFIYKEEASSSFEVYIICSANSFELCKGYKCIDVINQQTTEFSNYDEYEQYFLRREENE